MNEQILIQHALKLLAESEYDRQDVSPDMIAEKLSLPPEQIEQLLQDSRQGNKPMLQNIGKGENRRAFPKGVPNPVIFDGIAAAALADGIIVDGLVQPSQQQVAAVFLSFFCKARQRIKRFLGVVQNVLDVRKLRQKGRMRRRET